MSDENSLKEENIQITIKDENSDVKKQKQKQKSDECIELKNIQYKTMLLNGVQKEIKISKTEEDIENILEKEKNLISNVPWTKLEKGIKIKKLVEFANKYEKENSLTASETLNLKNILKNAIDRKHLQRMKDIEYDKEKGVIINIPLLTFNSTTRKFVLRRQEKKSTQKSFTPLRRKGSRGKVSKTHKQAKAGKTAKAKTQKEKKVTHNKTSKSPPAKTLKKQKNSKTAIKSSVTDSE